MGCSSGCYSYADKDCSSKVGVSEAGFVNVLVAKIAVIEKDNSNDSLYKLMKK